MKFLILVFLSLTINICAQVSIITNKNSSINSISKAELANLYTLTLRKLENEATVTVVDSKSTETRNIFYKFIQKDPNRLKFEWQRMKLAGEAALPKGFTTDADIINEVLKTNGAIAFIASKNLTGDVKVLLEIK